MTRPFVSCRPDDELHSVWQAMTKRTLQNVPVLAPTRGQSAFWTYAMR